MYKAVDWSSQSPLSSVSFSQMVDNDKENYSSVYSSAGPILALSVMRNTFETMPGNNPVNIIDLSIETFRAPYTGWYKAHFSCQSARQSVTTNLPGNPTYTPAAPLVPALSLLDGFHFLVTCKSSSKPPIKHTYDNVTGASNTITQTSGLDPYIGVPVVRSCFVMSGVTVPVACTGYKWLSAGDAVSWYVYTYIADNNYDNFYGVDDRNYGKISMNTMQSSDGMGHGAPRTYTLKTTSNTAVVPVLPGAGSNDTLLDKALLTSLVTPGDSPLRYSFLMVQYAGSRGMPQTLLTVEKLLSEQYQPSEALEYTPK